MTRDPANLQAFNEARAMLDDLQSAETLDDLRQLSKHWLAVDNAEESADDLRDILRDHIRTYCHDCGIHCGYVGV
jgi:hypothetical protein